jgi:uncharacterized protein (DUF1330 family)
MPGFMPGDFEGNTAPIGTDSLDRTELKGATPCPSIWFTSVTAFRTEPNSKSTGASIGPTLEGHPIKFLAGYTPFEVLEGENVLGAFVGEWPSLEAAKAWYDSPAYKAIRHLRMDNASYTGLLLEAGFAPAQERLRNRIR